MTTNNIILLPFYWECPNKNAAVRDEVKILEKKQRRRRGESKSDQRSE